MAKPMEYDKLDLVEHKSKLVPKSVKSNLSDLPTDSFKVLHINMRSLVNKMHLFEFLLSQLDVEFSCIVIYENGFLMRNIFLNTS